MKQITTREKIFLGVGALGAVAIFVYFIFWPMLQGEQSESMSGLEEMQERLESVKRLEGMELLLVGVEERMGSQSGYEKMQFERGIADSAIIRYLAEIAKQADIKELEQLDAKPDTSRRTRTSAGKNEQAVLRSVVNLIADGAKTGKVIISEVKREHPDSKPEDIEQALQHASWLARVVDQMYLVQVMDEVKQAADSTNEGAVEASVSDSDAPEEAKNMEQAGQGGPPDDREITQKAKPTDPDVLEESSAVGPPLEESASPGPPLEKSPEPSSPLEKEDIGGSPGSTGDTERIKPEFPMVPKDIADDVRQLLARFVEAGQGSTIGTADISRILEEVDVENEKEKGRIARLLRLYSDGVRKRKSETLRWLSKLGISENVETGQKVGKFSVKMVFKSQMDQLVKLLYNLQDSAKWLKIESMRISVSDRRQTLLSVELSMTATALYD